MNSEIKKTRQKVDWDRVKDKIIELLPKHTLEELAGRLGVSKQRLHQQLVIWGVTIRKLPKSPTDMTTRKCKICGVDLPQMRKQRIRVCKKCNSRWVVKEVNL